VLLLEILRALGTTEFSGFYVNQSLAGQTIQLGGVTFVLDKVITMCEFPP
jgi:hypothetical protein